MTQDEGFTHEFDIFNPRLDDLGDLLNAATRAKDEHPERDVIIPLTTLDTKTAIFWRKYLERLQYIIDSVNAHPTYEMTVEKAHYYQEGKLGEGPGEWVNDIYLRVFTR